VFQIFKNIFKSTPKVNLSSLEDIAVDMHSHLIPAIDDGAKSKEESLEIISKMQDLGYQKIITTPHTMHGAYNNNSAIILDGKNKLLPFLKENNCSVAIEASSEYYLDSHFNQLIQNKDLLPFGDNYILFELSFISKPSSLETIIFNLQAEGYQPILAHPSRYGYFIDKDLSQLKKIKETGILFQLNLFSLLGVYGEKSKQTAELLIEEKLVDFVGTDIHNRAQIAYLDKLLCNYHLSELIQQDKLLNKTLL